MKRFLRPLAILAAILFIYVAAVLIHGTATDYQPEPEIAIEPLQAASRTLGPDSVFSLLTWNIGYAGLGAESDFFYDSGGFFFSGGKTVVTPEEQVRQNLAGILQTVANTKADMFLLQEVDFGSKRSHFSAQHDSLRKLYPDWAAWTADNYRTPRVPLPLLEPWKAYGRVHSGLLTLSAFPAAQSTRYQMPGNYPWPTRIFQLDRCALAHRIPLASGKELLVINVHLSAYDKGGVLKKEQMAFLREFCLAEYEKGNYVVVGGDWNQCPPFFPFDTFMPGNAHGYTEVQIDAAYFPADWAWIYDPTQPTNRKLRTPYVEGESFITLIDFFLISPNLQAVQVKTIDQDFRVSDHQPVWLELALTKP